ncbi:MAG TPA: hypothetical protein VEB19_18635 [Gemmatimonadaceae bacterium]|nr:hypothetical protein [Gemmatimonadaceae bacterium]
MAVAIDTLAYARRLREAGLSERQAEGHAEALAAAMTDSLATKQDLRETEGRIDVRFAQVDARFAQIDARFDHLERHFDMRLSELEKRIDLRLHGALSDLEHRMTLRLGGIMVAGIGILTAVVGLV